MTNITINMTNNTIEVSKAFVVKASKYGSDAYRELKAAQAENPNFRLVVKAPRKANRDTLKGLTYEFMEKYILGHKKELHDEFLNRIGRSNNEYGFVIKGEYYMSVKKWFLENFPEIAEFENKAKNYKAA